MRARAAAALQKALTFQDVREGVAEEIPSAVAPLVELLTRKASTKWWEKIPAKHEEDVGVPRHDQSSPRGLGPESDGQKEPFRPGSKVHCVTLNHIALHCSTLHRIADIALRYIALHYTTLQFITTTALLLLLLLLCFRAAFPPCANFLALSR